MQVPLAGLVPPNTRSSPTNWQSAFAPHEPLGSGNSSARVSKPDSDSHCSFELEEDDSDEDDDTNFDHRYHGYYGQSDIY